MGLERISKSSGARSASRRGSIQRQQLEADNDAARGDGEDSNAVALNTERARNVAPKLVLESLARGRPSVACDCQKVEEKPNLDLYRGGDGSLSPFLLLLPLIILAAIGLALTDATHACGTRAVLRVAVIVVDAEARLAAIEAHCRDLAGEKLGAATLVLGQHAVARDEDSVAGVLAARPQGRGGLLPLILPVVLARLIFILATLGLTLTDATHAGRQRAVLHVAVVIVDAEAGLAILAEAYGRDLAGKELGASALVLGQHAVTRNEDSVTGVLAARAVVGALLLLLCLVLRLRLILTGPLVAALACAPCPDLLVVPLVLLLRLLVLLRDSELCCRAADAGSGCSGRVERLVPRLIVRVVCAKPVDKGAHAHDHARVNYVAGNDDGGGASRGRLPGLGRNGRRRGLSRRTRGRAGARGRVRAAVGHLRERRLRREVQVKAEGGGALGGAATGICRGLKPLEDSILVEQVRVVQAREHHRHCA